MHAVGALGTTQTLIDALETAHDVVLDAYVLRNPHLIAALERAASRGARVDVRLCERPEGPPELAACNARLAKLLHARGIRVELEPPFGACSRHDKFADVDGRAFYDDRNWTTDPRETVVVGDAAALRCLQTKRDALASEARLIRRGRGSVIATTESFGPGPVADALLARARRGDDVRLVCGPLARRRNRRLLARLRDAGVRVRFSGAHHKLAAVGTCAWIGSANATLPSATREWALRARGNVATALREVADRLWAASKSR